MDRTAWFSSIFQFSGLCSVMQTFQTWLLRYADHGTGVFSLLAYCMALVGCWWTVTSNQIRRATYPTSDDLIHTAAKVWNLPWSQHCLGNSSKHKYIMLIFCPFADLLVSLSVHRPTLHSLLKDNKNCKFYEREICVYCSYLEIAMPHTHTHTHTHSHTHTHTYIYIHTLLRLATLSAFYVI